MILLFTRKKYGLKVPELFFLTTNTLKTPLFKWFQANISSLSRNIYETAL